MNNRYPCALIAVAVFALDACARAGSIEPVASAPRLPCSAPVSLVGADTRPESAPVIDDYIVLVKEGHAVAVEGARLAKKYDFTISETFWIIPAFVAKLRPGTVESLRCEASIQSIEFSRTNIPPP